ncbi:MULTISPECIES: hypothetical protein [Fusobacterium]|jgi:hypothetical protein|uniref:Uncharacterized protein n=1 Tax=Fusobacterium vincentii TaxID=155615 RepID=A0AAJ1FMX5_FUSVC|nr:MULTISPECIES: hypothetical protein [Fusobacterium]ERT46497.1 hypothetical protein HMPREF1768_00639 [Fusobacterium nucleatum CTI-7]MCW0263690.1 hypothetical protein [Fusobacterium vincentii]STO30271.1 Uncharacterised protein [Fusobacterium vincentii]
MKVTTKKIKNTDEYSITRYSISGIILKTIIFIILYLVYMSLGIYHFMEILSSKIIIKFVVGSLPFFLFLYSEVILASSKEFLLIKEDNLILKKYILFFCYYSKVIKLEDIRKIYYEKVTYKNYPVLFLPTDLLKKKIRVKDSEFEDKIYAFGYKMSEYESYKIIEEVEDVIKVKKFYI